MEMEILVERWFWKYISKSVSVLCQSTFQDIKGKSAHLNTKPVLLYDEMVMLSKVDLNLNLPESARPETKEFWNRRIWQMSVRVDKGGVIVAGLGWRGFFEDCDSTTSSHRSCDGWLSDRHRHQSPQNRLRGETWSTLKTLPEAQWTHGIESQ